MYQLYIEKNRKLTIKKLTKAFEYNRPKFEEQLKASEDDWFQYNDNYIFSNDRKVLKTLAQQMKDNWIMGLSIELEEVKNIKI